MKTIKLIDTITPEIEESVLSQFKTWAKSHEGRILMELDAWHSFEVPGGGFVDVHFILDDTLELFLYPCNKTTTHNNEVFLSTDCINEVVIEEEAVRSLIPIWLYQYINEIKREAV
jgi:hypothetical protein